MPGHFPTPTTPDFGFVACIEGGVLERQALLLFESIRRYAGRFSQCNLYALSPRAGHEVSNGARAKMEALQVRHIDTVLNTGCPEYGSANRVAAAAHVEGLGLHAMLVILDSDTLFLREPVEFFLPDTLDAAVRPVDVKGMCTTGPDDPADRYWRELCDCCGVDYETIPWVESFVDRQRVKASYNGGLVVARTGVGILQRWADFFNASIRRGLRPNPAAAPFRAGAGWVEPAAASLWGSNQAALSLALWSSTPRVGHLSPAYNYPLHLHGHIDRAVAEAVFPRLAHVHYHWLLEGDAPEANPLFSKTGPLSPEQRDWLATAESAATAGGAA